jgi:DNA-binding MarR family transcriptional regulator
MIMTQEDFQTLLQFFKTLADENRLKIVGILADQECSVEELAAILHLKAPTVSHHLAKLKELNLVEMRPEGNTHVYRLNAEALRNSNKQLLTPEKMASLVDNVEADAWERKVLKDFFDGTQLKEIPASRKKRSVVLKWFASQFTENVFYKEAEVNEILQAHNADAAYWRRELVGASLMQRENGFYWRMPLAELPGSPVKRSIILKWLANQFEERMLYRESEVDELIGRYFPDPASLRQELLKAELIRGEDGYYWKL